MKSNPHPADNNRILIIDDNPTIHGDFRKILLGSSSASAALDDVLADVFGEKPTKGAKLEFQIDSAYQGEEGLDKVSLALEEGRPYALAFVDMRMPPGWDGVETITRIWAKDPGIQIVICTAYSDYSWQEIVTQLGNSDRLVILKKPFDSIEVLQLAHAMTKKWLVTLQANQKLEELDRLVREQTIELQDRNDRLSAEIKESELTRKQLRHSEERLARAFEACPLPTAILRLHDHGCVLVNQAFVEATGYDREEMLGRSPWTTGLAMNTGTLLTMMGDLAQGGEVIRHECRIVTKSSTQRPALLWIEPFELASGPHLLAIVQDVSDRQNLEDELKHAQQVAAVGHLAAGVAGDLNNLLTIILGYSDIELKRDNIAPELQSALGEVQNAGERAAALTRQLLAFSRRQVMQKRTVTLSGLVNNIEAMLRRLVPANVRLTLEHPASQPPILADVCNIEHVIMNLVMNSLTAMPAGGSLSISTSVTQVLAPKSNSATTEPSGEFVRLTVTDTGEGMTEHTMAQIFEPFFTTKRSGTGHGMGLVTSKSIVQQHDGWIEVSSSPGQGSTFQVFFPACKVADDVKPCLHSPAHEGSKEVVLLVEDDDKVRALARNVLQAAGYLVLEAPDGPKAITAWRNFDKRIDLLLTDMVMPGGLSGRDLAERFHTERPDGKVIYSSGYSADLFGEDLEMVEGSNYLAKPYFAEQLTAAVAKASSRKNEPSLEEK